MFDFRPVAALCALAMLPAVTFAADDVSALRAELQTMKSDYQARVDALEARIRQLEDSGLTFLEFVEKHSLEHEEGNLFSYLVRVMNFAQKLYQASQLTEFEDMAERVRKLLARIDLRLGERAW